MKHWEHFSGFKPAKEDFHFERDAKELHIKNHIMDLTKGLIEGCGILKGVLDELQVYVDNPAQFVNVKVKTGEAYIQGEKTEVAEEQTVELTEVETEANIIWLKYKLIDSNDPNAIRNHYITGEPYVVWKVDSFELGATKESQYVASINELKLARVAKVSGQLVVTHDYRTFLKINANVWSNYVNDSDFYVGGPAGTGRKVLVKQTAPPMPTRLTLTTGWDDVFRKTGAAAGLVSFRPSYIKAEFGDKGTGTASGITFTWASNRVGNWTTNEWANQYLTCSDGNSWKVVSNTTDTLTLEATALPVTGIFWLGPNATGYKFIIQILDATDETVKGTMEAEAALLESPVKMEYVWHGLTPDIKYSIKVASRGGWFQDEWSAFCTALTIIAGGAKIIPDACADTVKNVTIAAEDDGIRISWDIEAAYTNEVAGVEIVHTDDGTEPNFDTLGHKKVYTDRKAIVLPAKHSTDTSNITVKAKIRAVDKAGRHCVTPISITPVTAKKYLGDIADIVTEIKTARGNASSLNGRMSMSLDANGRSLGITEAESEIADARGTYTTIGERIAALSAAGFDFQYVRVVAKSGSLYQTWQAAVNSISNVADESATPPKYLILVMPGIYQEDVNVQGKRNLMFMGLGATLKGILYNTLASGDLYQTVILIDGLRIYNIVPGSGGNTRRCISLLGAANDNTPLEIRNSVIINTSTYSGDMAVKLFGMRKYMIKNSYVRAAGENVAVYFGTPVGEGDIKLLHSDFRAATPNVSTGQVVEFAAGNEIGHVFDCSFGADNAAPCMRASGADIKVAHIRYTTAPAGGNYDYGTLGNQSNVLFDPGDLSMFDEWPE